MLSLLKFSTKPTKNSVRPPSSCGLVHQLASKCANHPSHPPMIETLTRLKNTPEAQTAHGMRLPEVRMRYT
jgi:hypothetical protein